MEEGLDFVSERTLDVPSSVAAGRRLAEDLLKLYPETDCIYFSNDDLAVGGLGYCVENNIPVPDAVALVGFNDLDLLNAFPGKIATSRTARQQIGRKAA